MRHFLIGGMAAFALAGCNMGGEEAEAAPGAENASAAASHAAATPAPVRLPIETGSYVNVGEECGAPIVATHYDGERIRWLYPDPAESFAETPRAVAQDGNVYTLESMESYEMPSNSDEPEMAPIQTRIEVKARDRILISVQDDVEARLCAPESLPEAIRRQIG